MSPLGDASGSLQSTTQSDAGTEATERNTMALQSMQLPAELILIVASMLPTSSAACLALSSRRISKILGPGHWRSLQSGAPSVLLQFLKSLARDLPQYFVCQECPTLHHIQSIKRPQVIERGFNPFCVWIGRGYHLLSQSQYRVYFPHVQLAMRQYRSGIDIGFPLAVFQNLEMKYNRTHQKFTLLSIDAQIIQNDLLLRSQTWVLIPWSQRDGYLDQLVDGLHQDICIHTSSGLLGKHLTTNLVKSRLAQLEAHEEIHPQTLQCPECWMEHELDIADFGKRGFAILITKWVNLGSGLDFKDPKWQSHVMPRANSNAGHPRQTGDIKKNFEAQTETPMKDLTADHKLKLSSGRHDRLAYPDSDGIPCKREETSDGKAN
ncbi:hypothetical protein EYC80_002221 [Monilinia laxa]|uniref:F-box domain-containing protein n=1 Tax=Monilinia laxa TaxID=61186 RepID=A0A5N6K3T4_MONLA|nr:hypothetical protein EYC80_002221 [Monilinia laxa]